MNTQINRGDVMRSTCFEQNGMTRVCQRGHQRQHVFLQKRFSSSDLDERTAKPDHGLYDLSKSLFFSFVKSVFGIAIIAAQIAEG